MNELYKMQQRAEYLGLAARIVGSAILLGATCLIVRWLGL